MGIERTLMYCVYAKNIEGTPIGLEISDLNAAIEMCAAMRKAGTYRFVTMTVEDENHVGKMGVTEVDETYDWVKRRDSIKVRKNNEE
jgi:hypothetical protein